MADLSLFDVQLTAAAPAAPAAPTPAAAVPLPRQVDRAAVVVVDGNSLTHRAYHAYSRRPDVRGPVAAGLYGIVALLCGVTDVAAADGVIVAFDDPSSNVRKTWYPAYKAGRAEKDDDLRGLLTAAPRLLFDLGLNVVSVSGWEADDVLGSAAATVERERPGRRCVVATSDKDASDLISGPAEGRGHTDMLRLGSGLANAVLMDKAALVRQEKIRPGQYLQLAAMRGDSSDNLDGLSGIGPAKGRQLLACYATVADAVADPLGCRSVLGSALGQKLIDDWHSPDSVVRRNLRMMAIRRDLPVDLMAAALPTDPHHTERVLRDAGLGGLVLRSVIALCNP